MTGGILITVTKDNVVIFPNSPVNSEGLGHLATDSNLKLSQYGEYLYDGLVLFSSTVQKFGGSLDLNYVLEFVDSGRDLILAVDGLASELVREIATECGVDFNEDFAAVVIDHGSFANGDHMLIASDDFIDFLMSF
ncbi:hypothetical protein IFM89_038091 [Coptis chinensis]|uniref:Dolichyl-diphosphooligosaccharide--protein glycosyltransferase 48 kDa subunit n=1 Tax=Coptis chinensis TaxID=261450 RepID=A0A835LJY1_9MAGN|nr:hypothetical protein IFM89_038091 [Coptis chinensis]